MKTQLNRGEPRRVVYVERKGSGEARIGWATFSRTGRTVYYDGLTLQAGQGIGSNFFDVETGDGYWVSGVKTRGSNAHGAEAGVAIKIDEDAREEYRAIRSRT